jgi:putative transposase
LRNFNYSQHGAYFITICTQDHTASFEKTAKPKYVPLIYWNELAIRFPEIELDQFVVMPNHIHGIIFILAENVGAIHELPLQPNWDRNPYGVINS